MSNHKRSKQNNCKYILTINDWHVKILFNDDAYQRIFDDSEFEERISMEMTGRLISTTSKKCKDNMAATIDIKPNELWYQRDRLREDLHAIGNIYIERADSEFYQEDTICFWITVPTKSYENMKDYLSYKGKAQLNLVGTELLYRKGEIYSLEFCK
ncbi:MAG: hypothetical protein DHS20C13_14340 [Thermodesulfobacteriota bacterium]|nr:MAG: hypothetical protein DHS20C13_14340 [Thermodesulfobacteriota bacterium]